jgi:hypothetical protein
MVVMLMKMVLAQCQEWRLWHHLTLNILLNLFRAMVFVLLRRWYPSLFLSLWAVLAEILS